MKVASDLPPQSLVEDPRTGGGAVDFHELQKNHQLERPLPHWRDPCLQNKNFRRFTPMWKWIF